jgi:preprotein translocase subunit YajC
MFCGGMLGVVASVKEQTFVVKVAENVKLEVARGAVVKVLDKDEAPGEVDNK